MEIVDKPRVVASIEARMGSSRLSGKMLADVAGQPALLRVLERLKRAATLEALVVATTVEAYDEPLVDLARGTGVPCFRGSEDDVLGRVVGAHRMMGSDVVVEITGDCTLIDPEVVDLGVSTFLANDADVVTNVVKPSFPMGIDVQIFRLAALADVDQACTTRWCASMFRCSSETLSRYRQRSSVSARAEALSCPPTSASARLCRGPAADQGNLSAHGAAIRRCVRHARNSSVVGRGAGARQDQQPLQRKTAAMSRQFRTALVGLGNIGLGFADDPLTRRHYRYASHAQVLAAHPSFAWEAAVDSNPEVAAQTQARWGIAHAVSTMPDLLSRYDPEVLVLATPPSARIPAVQVCPGLKAVLCEKPLGGTLGEARAFLDLCEARGTLVQVNLRRRCDTLSRKLAVRELEAMIGQPQAVRGLYGNGLLNNGTHLVDFCRMLFGDVEFS